MPYELEREIAWAAGFFDGEGCTTICGRQVRIQVKQVDPRPLERFYAAIGKVGTIRLEPRRGGSRPIYVWYAQRAGVVFHVLDRLWPYLSEPKKEQAEFVERRWGELQVEAIPLDRIKESLARKPLNVAMFGKQRAELTVDERRAYDRVKAERKRRREGRKPITECLVRQMFGKPAAELTKDELLEYRRAIHHRKKLRGAVCLTQ